MEVSTVLQYENCVRTYGKYRDLETEFSVSAGFLLLRRFRVQVYDKKVIKKYVSYSYYFNNSRTFLIRAPIVPSDPQNVASRMPFTTSKMKVDDDSGASRG